MGQAYNLSTTEATEPGADLMADEPSARITLKEVYAQVQEMKSLLERLANSLPSIGKQLDDLEKEVKEQLNDHEKRIRVTEKRIWQIMAIAGFVSAAMPLILRFL